MLDGIANRDSDKECAAATTSRLSQNVPTSAPLRDVAYRQASNERPSPSAAGIESTISGLVNARVLNMLAGCRGGISAGPQKSGVPFVAVLDRFDAQEEDWRKRASWPAEIPSDALRQAERIARPKPW